MNYCRDKDFISHVGVGHEDDPPGRGSGRYGWGTGKNPGQHQHTFLSEVSRMRKDGLTNKQISEILLGEGSNTTDLRAEISIETTKERSANQARAIELLDECNGNVSEVARRMGKNESSIRSLLDPVKAARADRYRSTAEELKKIIAKQGIVDIGKDTELYLGVPDTTKKVAIKLLEKEGYVKSWVKIPQLGTQHETTMIVLAPPGTSHSDIQKGKLDIKPIQEFTPDKGKTWWTPEYPSSVDSKRIMVRYKEDGGAEKDGVIELRRGIDELSLGRSQYAQVRIAVDDSHYMKGMAMYADDSDFPKGVDIIYNSNKKRGTPLMSPDDNASQVLKPLKKDKNGNVDKENPFGALIKGPKERDGIIMPAGQRHYIDKDGKDRLSPINKLQDEGDWDSWSRNLASQFLSKQPQKLIDQQISLTLADKKMELETIKDLTNPVIKKKLLDQYANNCDKKASELSVRGFKNQAFQVILPIPDLKENEIYAPNYDDGDVVALIRYPHGGTFEIPQLRVNNKNEKAKRVMRNASDAVGINSKVAERLSGADFDGDTALVIPMKSNKLNVVSTPSLPGLKDFDAKELYKLPDSAPRMKNQTKQNQMGQVTNLITDMTIQGATDRDICKAVRHSMVVIDAEKHHLDYKRSAIDNDIRALKKEYQGQVNPRTGKLNTGASTILSRASAEVYIDQRKEVTDRNKMTPEQVKRFDAGYKIYVPTGKKKTVQIKDPKQMTSEEINLYKAGKKIYRVSDEATQEKITRMDLVDDARDLVRDRDNDKEMAYANYANELKALARDARRTSRSIKPTPINQSAKRVYAKEVEDLNSKLRTAKLNTPRERQATVIANNIVRERRADNPDWDFEHLQREKARALNQARSMVGAKKDLVVITDKEFEAIQAGAISSSRLSEILDNTDIDKFKKMATPRTASNGSLSIAQINKAKAMAASGMYTQKEIAESLGVSASTVSKALRNN